MHDSDAKGKNAYIFVITLIEAEIFQINRFFVSIKKSFGYKIEWKLMNSRKA